VLRLRPRCGRKDDCWEKRYGVTGLGVCGFLLCAFGEPPHFISRTSASSSVERTSSKKRRRRRRRSDSQGFSREYLTTRDTTDIQSIWTSLSLARTFTCMPASPNRSPRSSVDRALNNNVHSSQSQLTSPKLNNSITPGQQYSNPIMKSATQNNIGGSRGRRESRPITSIATTTTTAPVVGANTTVGAAHLHRMGNSSSPVTTRTEDTTFSLPIDIIDTPHLDELCLSPVGSAPSTRPPSPLSLTPVSPFMTLLIVGSSS
jgi:hypothetical protein